MIHQRLGTDSSNLLEVWRPPYYETYDPFAENVMIVFDPLVEIAGEFVMIPE